MKKKLPGIINFLKVDIWRIKSSQLSGQKSFWVRQLRIILLAIRGFDEDKCLLRASALTFYSLMSIVPVVAMAFGIAKGFGFEKKLEKQIISGFAGQEEVANRIIAFSNSMLENTQGGIIAGIGVAILFWTVIKVLGNIEDAFNGIWGVKKGRTLGRKFADYLSIMLLCPVLMIMSSSITVLISSQIKLIVEKISLLGPLAPIIFTGLRILPFVALWVMFTFIYVMMPNTKVQVKSGILAGVIAGTIYQLVQFVYISFQIGVSKYGAIYGSFAALPLFLIWLQLSWLVILFGAELSFAEQNVETYEFEPDSLQVSQAFKKLLALNVVYLCVRNFRDAKQPWSASELSHHLEMPIRLVNQVLYELIDAGVLTEVKNEDDAKTPAFQPALDIDKITIHYVTDAIENRGSDRIPFAQTKEYEALSNSLSEFQKAVSASSQNVQLKNI